MIAHFLLRRMLFAGIFPAALVCAAAAQQNAGAPAAGGQSALPPGSPLIGRPDSEAAQRLAPVAPTAFC